MADKMQAMTLVLKIAAPIFLIVGALHLFLGAAADVMLGARLSAESLADPVLDSQNRFYGVVFSLYGVLLYLCATDLSRYRPVFVSVLLVFFAGGLARLVSLATHGLPSAPVIGLFASEVLIPPLLYWWLTRLQDDN